MNYLLHNYARQSYDHSHPHNFGVNCPFKQLLISVFIDEHWPLDILPHIFYLSISQRVRQNVLLFYTHTKTHAMDSDTQFASEILLDFCRRATHPERTRTVLSTRSVSQEHWALSRLPGHGWTVTIDTCIHLDTSVQTPEILVSHPAPSLSVYHPDPDTVAKGARGGGGSLHPHKRNKNHSVLCTLPVSEFHFISGYIDAWPLLLRPILCGRFVTLQSERMSQCFTFFHTKPVLK